MKLILFRLLAAYLWVSAAAGCHSTRPQPDERPNAQLVTPPVEIDTPGMSPTSVSVTPLSGINVAQSTPGILSGIGGIFSTREGRARRQAVKLAKAAAPKVGKGGVLAINSNVSNGYKARAPVTTADTGAVVSNAAENSQQQNVKGNNNGLTADKHDTTQQAKDWKAELATPVGKTIAIALFVLTLACIGGVLYYVIPLLPKRRKDPVA